MKFLDRLSHAWNAFTNPNQPLEFSGTQSFYSGGISNVRPDRIMMSRRTERSIITSIYNRIALDVSAIKIRHVKLNNEGNYIYEIDSTLNNCLRTEANKDQQSRAFFQDVVMSLFDEGSIAVVPVDTEFDPNNKSDTIKIYTMRVGRIIQWFPNAVTVEVYNDKIGIRQQITMAKKSVAIIENPFYATMNEPSSTLQRLIRKLNILDAIDEQSGSNKLDLIIQLPYTVRTDLRRAQAEKRRKDIEEQLTGSKYGIAYTDGSEKITQLNRSVENNILKQIEYLTSMLYSQLNMNQSILDGTANEATMLNYMNRTVEVIVSAITLEFERKFLSKTARTQKQAIRFFNEPFKLMPMSQLADFADKFTRNAILSSNEIRQLIGFKPVESAEANELSNKNLNKPAGQEVPIVEDTTNKVEVIEGVEGG